MTRLGLTADEHLLQCEADLDDSDDAARVEGIRQEIASGFAALTPIGKAVSVFGSARVPRDDPRYELTRRVAAALGAAGFTIITGGGPGLMEAANRGANDAGATSVGLGIELLHEQRPNDHLDVSVTFRHFFARKLMFIRYASAFVVMPGGFGTLDELFEAMTLIQTKKIHEFPVVLVGDPYWRGLMTWLREGLQAEGFIAASDADLLVVSDDPREITALVQRCHQRRLGRAAMRQT